MIHYKEAEYNPIKLEISFRGLDDWNNTNKHSDTVNINDIHTYNINRLSDNKINTFLTRMAPRDIYDTAFLLEKYPNFINNKLVIKCIEKVNSVGLDQLENIIKSDDILKNCDHSQIVLNLEKNLNYFKDYPQAKVEFAQKQEQKVEQTRSFKR